MHSPSAESLLAAIEVSNREGGGEDDKARGESGLDERLLVESAGFDDLRGFSFSSVGRYALCQAELRRLWGEVVSRVR